MPELIDFLPVMTETVNTIRARVDADVNAGLTPADPGFIDTTPGGFYWDMTQGVLLEIERLYDVASVDLPASMFVGFAWGDYLDEHGAVLGVDRLPPTQAAVVVTFMGPPGTPIPSGTQVATTQSDPEADPVEYETTAGATVGGGGTVGVAALAVDTGTAANVPAGAVNVLLSAIDGIASVSNADAAGGGADQESDAAYRRRIVLEYQSAPGAGAVADYERWALAYPGVGNVKVIPLVQGPGTVGVVITDADNDPEPSPVTDGLQERLDPIAAATTLAGGVTLPATTINVASTTGFAASGAIVVGGSVVQYTGVTGASFTGCTGGTGTLAGGADVAQRGTGGGQAPIGAIVFVSTPAPVTVNVSASVEFSPGYSLDGASGTLPTRADLERAVSSYIDALAPGDAVVHNSVVSRFFLIPGVHDVPLLTLNGSLGNVTITASQVAAAGTVTLA